MNSFQIKSADDVYRFIEDLKSKCQGARATKLSSQLDDALHLGSSGLEILGALRHTLIENRVLIEQLLGASGKEQLNQVIAFVDKTYGC